MLWKPFCPKNSVIYVTICKRKVLENFISLGLKIKIIIFMKTEIKLCELQSYITCIIQTVKLQLSRKLTVYYSE